MIRDTQKRISYSFGDIQGREYRITELRINSNPKEYRLKDVDAAVALFYALLVSEYGGNSNPYWNAAF